MITRLRIAQTEAGARARNPLQARVLLYFPAIVETPGPMFITKPFITDRQIRFALVGLRPDLG